MPTHGKGHPKLLWSIPSRLDYNSLRLFFPGGWEWDMKHWSLDSCTHKNTHLWLLAISLFSAQTGKGEKRQCHWTFLYRVSCAPSRANWAAVGRMRSVMSLMPLRIRPGPIFSTTSTRNMAVVRLTAGFLCLYVNGDFSTGGKGKEATTKKDEEKGTMDRWTDLYTQPITVNAN